MLLDAALLAAPSDEVLALSEIGLSLCGERCLLPGRRRDQILAWDSLLVINGGKIGHLERVLGLDDFMLLKQVDGLGLLKDHLFSRLTYRRVG